MGEIHNQQLRELNEALLVASVRQHELAEQAEKAAEDLHHSELRFRRLFQSATDGLLILDADTGKVLDANTVVAGMVGMEPEEMLGKELFEIGIYKDAEQNEQELRQLREERYLRHENLSVQNRRGEEIEIELIASVYSEGDRMVVQCRIHDVSERVRMQKQIAEQAEALAGEARRKDEFLAMLSHELRNPLAPIRSAVHLMKMQDRGGGENPILTQAREIIERQVNNLTKLISDLLDVSRVTSGRIRLDLQVVDVNQIVQHAVETTMPLIERHGHELVLNLGNDPSWVNADATRLEEVFINLLNNAAKYTPEGGRIEVWCEHPEGADYAQFCLRDNGVGIDAKLLPHIFDLFTQAERSLARSAGGLGIGLSVAHRLVELHGGSIDVKSPPEDQSQGSEFVVRLPLVPAGEPVEPIAPSDEQQEKRGNIRVLVVDDNLDLVTMLSELLRQSGYFVQSAHTGPEGLSVAQSWRPEIILLDIGLPGLDGYEVARRLRSDPALGPARQSIKLIALTGYGQEADVILAREAGFDAHLAKPYDFDDLEKLMRSLQPEVT
jgi:PAS domain S-box-containing protein